MDLRSYLRAVRQRWWIVLAAVLIALGIGAAITIRTQPQYASTVTFFVNTPNEGVADAYQGNLFTQQRVKSYVDLLTSDRLAQSLASSSGLGLSTDGVRRRISGSTEPNTVLLQATVTDTQQSRALKLTEALTKTFPALVQQIETPPGDGAPTVKIELVNGPRLSTNPVSPRPARNLTFAGLLGLLVGLATAILREQLDNTVRSGIVLQRVASAAVLGQIPYDGESRTTPLIVGTAGQSLRAEALRKLRTNLRFVNIQEPSQVIAVTSATQGEGKTTTCCNLAITLAETGSRVLLVDADLRRPKVAHYFGLPSEVGLTDVLIGEVTVQDAVQPWGDKQLYVMASGSVPPNPSELLGSPRMAELLKSLREWADIVIIDTPPLLSVTDGAVVAVQTDGTVLVTRSGKTTQTQVTAAMRALQTVAARVLGCVLNMTKASKSDAYYYKSYKILSSEPAADISPVADIDAAEPVAATDPVDADAPLAPETEPAATGPAPQPGAKPHRRPGPQLTRTRR
ncbi:polysaccharide biosynthesis tyrosine autokinase [Rugosimonospora africana]|uniref:non-specific protein-tyrosine kinase n=1 Tax=Rugosimonospora africana TaxID=556532 RepID=A0A8J3VVT0_9ACTN|nr:polysaccharide biosynthesis tyrosine autokinase [Rugosimonospora africana]GIH20997.1 chromosome partitioning protein [Rugosimonospora africana]